MKSVPLGEVALGKLLIFFFRKLREGFPQKQSRTSPRGSLTRIVAVTRVERIAWGIRSVRPSVRSVTRLDVPDTDIVGERNKYRNCPR
jgi:hypothetical protein